MSYKYINIDKNLIRKSERIVTGKKERKKKTRLFRRGGNHEGPLEECYIVHVTRWSEIPSSLWVS